MDSETKEEETIASNKEKEGSEIRGRRNKRVKKRAKQVKGRKEAVK